MAEIDPRVEGGDKVLLSVYHVQADKCRGDLGEQDLNLKEEIDNIFRDAVQNKKLNDREGQGYVLTEVKKVC